MIKSMTGYGRSDFSIAEKSYTVEVKSLNHRYLDIKLRMPDQFFSLEEKYPRHDKEAFRQGAFFYKHQTL